VAAAVQTNTWPIAGVPNPISRSVRLRSSASAYLNRTPSVAGSLTTWTWSGWVKRGTLSASLNIPIFSAGTSGTNDTNITFNSDIIDWFNRNSSSINGRLNTTQVFRDPSAWYHLVFVWDTTNATASNRMRIYVNGSLVTALSTATYPGSSQASNVNNNVATYVGLQTGTSNYFDGYLTEINFIDGQALTPSSFSTTDSLTGVWMPMPYTGTYGTNGFYLNFKDNTDTTTIGYDYSGNSNNWTANNISLTAGTTYDSMLDVPTLWQGYNTGNTNTATRGNYCVINPLYPAPASITNGNLTFTNSSGLANQAYGTMVLPSSGTFYFEGKLTAVGGGSSLYINIGDGNTSYSTNGQIYSGGSLQTTVATYTTGDTISIAFT